MGFFGDLFGHDDAQKQNEYIYETEFVPEKHKASFTHEAIAAAAGFEAMKAYEDHLRTSGEEPSHPLMKELLAAFAAAEIDRLVETKGLDYIDRERAKEQAVAQAHALAAERYGEGQNGIEYMRNNGGFEEDYDPHYGRRHEHHHKHHHRREY